MVVGLCVFVQEVAVRGGGGVGLQSDGEISGQCLSGVLFMYCGFGVLPSVYLWRV